MTTKVKSHLNPVRQTFLIVYLVLPGEFVKNTDFRAPPLATWIRISREGPKNLYFCIIFKILDQVVYWTWLEIPKYIKECHRKVSFPSLSSPHPNSPSGGGDQCYWIFLVCVYSSSNMWIHNTRKVNICTFHLYVYICVCVCACIF